MEQHDSLSKKVQAFLDDFPDTEMSPTSRELLRNDPLGWVVSRNRALRAALQNDDWETVNTVTDDLAHVVGKRRAEFWKLEIWGRLVAKELDID